MITAGDAAELAEMAETVRAAGWTCLLQFSSGSNMYACVIGDPGAAPWGPAELVLHGAVYLADSIREADPSLLVATRRAVARWRADAPAAAADSDRHVPIWSDALALHADRRPAVLMLERMSRDAFEALRRAVEQERELRAREIEEYLEQARGERERAEPRADRWASWGRLPPPPDAAPHEVSSELARASALGITVHAQPCWMPVIPTAPGYQIAVLGLDRALWLDVVPVEPIATFPERLRHSITGGAQHLERAQEVLRAEQS